MEPRNDSGWGLASVACHLPPSPITKACMVAKPCVISGENVAKEPSRKGKEQAMPNPARRSEEPLIKVESPAQRGWGVVPMRWQSVLLSRFGSTISIHSTGNR